MASAKGATCGRELDEHERDVRYGLPDPVLNLPDRELPQGTWMTGPSANESVMMQVPGVGPFVRSLLPVRLTGGYSVTFGVWVGIHPDDLQRAFKCWWAPEYADLELEGRLANALRPWGLLAAPVELKVLDENHTPYVVGSTNDQLKAVLAREWSHAEVLDALPTIGQA